MLKKSNKINSVIKITENYINTIAPQANKLDKIAVAIDVLKHSPINEKDLGTGFSLSNRQVDYYSNAMRFLGLINSFNYNEKIIISLSKAAQSYFKKGDIKRKLALWIIENKLLEEYKEKLEIINDSTHKRRKQSYNAWKKWVNEKI